MTSINRQIILEIAAIAKRAQEMALHNLEELEIPSDLSLQNKAFYCLHVATAERIRILLEQSQDKQWQNASLNDNVRGKSSAGNASSFQDSLG